MLKEKINNRRGIDGKYSNAYEETQGEKARQEKFSVMYQNEMYEGIKIATEILNNLGVKVYNASKTGNLNCMQRIDYETIFKKEAKI